MRSFGDPHLREAVECAPCWVLWSMANRHSCTILFVFDLTDNEHVFIHSFIPILAHSIPSTNHRTKTETSLILVRPPRRHRPLHHLPPRRRLRLPNPVTVLRRPPPALLLPQRQPPMLRLVRKRKGAVPRKRRLSGRQLLDCRSLRRRSAPSPRVVPLLFGRRTKRTPPVRLSKRRLMLRPSRSVLPRRKRRRRSRNDPAPRPKNGPNRRRHELAKKSRSVPAPKPPSARPRRSADRRSERQLSRPGRPVVEEDLSAVWPISSKPRRRKMRPRRRRLTTLITVAAPRHRLPPRRRLSAFLRRMTSSPLKPRLLWLVRGLVRAPRLQLLFVPVACVPVWGLQVEVFVLEDCVLVLPHPVPVLPLLAKNEPPKRGESSGPRQNCLDFVISTSAVVVRTISLTRPSNAVLPAEEVEVVAIEAAVEEVDGNAATHPLLAAATRGATAANLPVRGTTSGPEERRLLGLRPINMGAGAAVARTIPIRISWMMALPSCHFSTLRIGGCQ